MFKFQKKIDQTIFLSFHAPQKIKLKAILQVLEKNWPDKFFEFLCPPKN